MADRRLFRGHRATSKRVLLNRAALTALGQGIADGLGQFGQDVLDRAAPNVPDQEPIGLGLVRSGGWAVYVDGRKVGGAASAPSGRRDPQRPPRKGIVAYVGYGFPGRFQEVGTIRQPARPFLSPALGSVTPDLAQIVRAKVRDRLRGIR